MLEFGTSTYFTSDYRLTITLDTRLSDTEYRELKQLRQNCFAQRTEPAQDRKDAFEKSNDAAGIIRLPQYHLKRFSVYLYSSDDNFFETRPTSVATARDKVIAILDASCNKYAGADSASASAK
jgi:hypothetical protein